MSDGVRIRNLERAEVRLVLDWAAAEGWNPGLHDADAFFAADPRGFFALDVDGELAVTLSVVRYDASFAFMGFYICRPDLRATGSRSSCSSAHWRCATARSSASTASSSRSRTTHATAS